MTVRPTGETKAADRRDAEAEHTADRPPTPEEEALAEENDLDPSTAAAYREMAQRGANTEGEGRLP